jgi:hypothetical protein
MENPMSMQGDGTRHDSAHNAASDPTSILETARTVANDAAARLSNAAQAAERQARDAASGLAAEASQNVKGLLGDQIAAGSVLAGHLAGATRAAADRLAPDAPQLAGVVRNVARTIDDFSDAIRDRSVDDLVESASQFTRRQPAAVFGVAALAGFFLLRVLKAGGQRMPSGGGSYGA